MTENPNDLLGDLGAHDDEHDQKTVTDNPDHGADTVPTTDKREEKRVGDEDEIDLLPQDQ